MIPLLKDLLNTLFDAPDWRWRVMQEWPTIIGPLYKQARIHTITDDGVMTLGIYDARWMQELTLLSADIMATVNRYLNAPSDKPYIQQIRLQRVGPVKPRRSLSWPQPTEAVSVIQKKHAPLSPTQNKALTRINDHDMRHALQELLQTLSHE